MLEFGEFSAAGLRFSFIFYFRPPGKMWYKKTSLNPKPLCIKAAFKYFGLNFR